jgi:NAD(P)-dependent dehydrogenase (short-subunit alcohol dehydrogenase family)
MDRRVVLITGCSSGLGQEAASHLATMGHRVFASMRDTTRTVGLPGCEILQLDVSNDASVQAAVRTVIERAGQIDSLVNNAGIGAFGPIEETPLDIVRDVFETNVHGVIRVIQAVLPHMRRQRHGTIINISSGLGRYSAPFFGIYASTKFALEGLSEALRYECMSFGVAVVVVEPGYVPTNFLGSMQRFTGGASSPYDVLVRRALASMERKPPGASSQDIADVIARIIGGETLGLRVPVGSDIEAILAAQRGLSDSDFQAFRIQQLGLWNAEE